MPGVVHNLRRIFSKPAEIHSIPPFKQVNYLNTMDHRHLVDLILFVEQRHFGEIPIETKGLTVLFISSPETRFLLERVLATYPSRLINYQLTPHAMPENPLLYRVIGALRPMAIPSNRFDILFFPASAYFKIDFIPYIVQISNALVHGGRALLSFIHPSLELFLYNQNPASPARASNTFQGYFNALRENDLYIETVLEGVVDKETKPFFSGPQGSSYFDEFRAIPLVLFMKVVKYMKPGV